MFCMKILLTLTLKLLSDKYMQESTKGLSMQAKGNTQL